MREIDINGKNLHEIGSLLPDQNISEDLHVTISENGTTKLGQDFWKILLGDQRLRALSLINLQIYQSDSKVLAEFLSQTKNLVELTMQSVQVHFHAFNEILAGLQTNSSVNRFVLSNLDKPDAAIIASLIQHNETIRHLSLIKNDLSPTLALLIADGLRKNSTLQSLDLSENEIGNDGAMSFYEILRNNHPSLVYLNLNENKIDQKTQEKLRSVANRVHLSFSPETELIVINDEEKKSLVVIENKKTVHYFAMILVTFLFFLWGVPNQLNDVLIRQFSKAFVLSRFEAGLVQSAFYLGYFCWSLPAAYVLRRWDYKVGLIVGLILFGTGCLMFWPAALIGEYVPFLGSLFIIATGLAFLETAANPFIAHAAGPTESSEKRLNFAQAFNPLGAITGALVGTLFIFSGIELNNNEINEMKNNNTLAVYLKEETLRVVKPYVVLGLIALVWALLIALTPFPKNSSNENESQNSKKTEGRANPCRPLFLFAIVAQFCYIGAQVGTWSYFIQYSQDYVGVSEKIAGYLLTGTLVMFAIGRLSAALLMHFGFSPPMLLATFSMINVLLIVFVIVLPNKFGLVALFITSFFMSLMFPTIFALAIKDFSGHAAKLAGCLLVMSIVGGAVFAPLMGLINEKTKSLAIAYSLPGAAYLLIAVYALLAFAATPK